MGRPVGRRVGWRLEVVMLVVLGLYDPIIFLLAACIALGRTCRIYRSLLVSSSPGVSYMGNVYRVLTALSQYDKDLGVWLGHYGILWYGGVYIPLRWGVGVESLDPPLIGGKCQDGAFGSE